MKKISLRPKPFEFYTASDLWNDEHISEQMLASHLNGENDFASRNTMFIERSVKWISSFFKVGAGTKIADFGCGPGLYTTRLGRIRADVTGIDLSARSIQYAKDTATDERLSIKYVNQNYLEYETDERFDIILLIYHDFGVLSPSQRRILLSKFRTFLKPDGYICLDVPSLKAFGKRKEVVVYEPNLDSHFWSPNKYHGFLNTFKYERKKLILDKYTIIEANGTRVIYNWQQYYSPEMLEKEFASRRLKINHFFSDVAGSKFDSENKEFAVVAQKI